MAWVVIYNAENRPINWQCGTTNIVMKYDYMGRRVEYLETVAAEGVAANNESASVVTNVHHKFVYDGYLQLQRLNGSDNPVDLSFEWDPTEPVATRPLFMQQRNPSGNPSNYFFTHDGNKNVLDVVSYQRARGVVAHYDYAPFGAVTSATGPLADTNPFRFSSEYHDDTLGLVYYNYRHYNPSEGRWINRDPKEKSEYNRYIFVNNNITGFVDSIGLEIAIDERNSPIYLDIIDSNADEGISHPRAVMKVYSVGIRFDCDSEGNLSIKGRISRKIEMLKSTDPRWNERRPWYDVHGFVRSNAEEMKYALMHELDHYQSYDEVFEYARLLNSYEGKYKDYCECIEKLYSIKREYNKLVRQAKQQSKSYDEVGRREGGLYPW